MSEEKPRWKGKFMKKKLCNHMLKRSETGKKNKKILIDQIVEEENEVPTEGNRIIDMKLLAKNMVCTSCKEPLLLRNIESETVRGVSSIFYIGCRDCL